jgi:UV DNA damage endonuclease
LVSFFYSVVDKPHHIGNITHMILPSNIVPSLCCIHTGLQEQEIKFNVMTYAQYVKLGKDAAMKILADRSLNNIKTIHSILKECAKNGWNYRIGSNVFPLMTHPDLDFTVDDFCNADEIHAEFAAAAQTIKVNNIRCSMHPDQFVVPASPNSKTVENSIRDLEQHAMIMDMLELPQSYEAPINIHMNCYNDGKFGEVVDRLEKVHKRLSRSVMSRLVYENEDKGKSWTVVNLYNHVYERMNVPITFDNLHNKCNPSNLLDEEEAFEMAVSTWPKDVVPLFHFSESLPGKNPRAHADFPTMLPAIYKNYTNPLHLDFEFKLKEIAINKISREKVLTICG